MQKLQHGVEFNILTKRFHRFLNSDRRLEMSLSSLSSFYAFDSHVSKGGHIALRKFKDVDREIAYREPEVLLAPYALLEVFQARAT
jgi:hypothetical protein